MRGCGGGFITGGRGTLRTVGSPSSDAQFERFCPYAVRTLSSREDYHAPAFSKTRRSHRTPCVREQKRVLAAAAAYERLDLTTFVMRSSFTGGRRNRRPARADRID